MDHHQKFILTIVLILSEPIENSSKKQSKTSDYLSQKDIQWHFNPPASPHFGGIWERLVQSSKNSLKVAIHDQVVTDEVLETAFAETEALVNSIPLTEVSRDWRQWFGGDYSESFPFLVLIPC